MENMLFHCPITFDQNFGVDHLTRCSQTGNPPGGYLHWVCLLWFGSECNCSWHPTALVWVQTHLILSNSYAFLFILHQHLENTTQHKSPYHLFCYYFGTIMHSKASHPFCVPHHFPALVCCYTCIVKINDGVIDSNTHTGFFYFS